MSKRMMEGRSEKSEWLIENDLYSESLNCKIDVHFGSQKRWRSRLEVTAALGDAGGSAVVRAPKVKPTELPRGGKVLSGDASEREVG